MPRLSVAGALVMFAVALPASSVTAAAANVVPSFNRPDNAIITVGSRERRARPRDCTPTNGPFGFYGNIWCEPPSEAQYIRNLGAGWPMKTPRGFRNPKPSYSDSTDW